MANTLTQRVLEDGARLYTILLHNDSDGTNETLVKKIDVTTMSGYIATNPNFNYLNCKIEQIYFAATGGISCKLYWEATTNKLAYSVPPSYSDKDDFMPIGGLPNENFGLAGNTGCLLLTTLGASVGSSYNMIIRLTKGSG
jgi:hypothetical protein